MVSLSAVLYLIVRTLPRIAGESNEKQSGGLFHRFRHSGLTEKFDAALNGFLLKFLRKFKVSVLKLDNTLSRHLQKIKPEENTKNSSIDFKEMAGQNKEGDRDSV